MRGHLAREREREGEDLFILFKAVLCRSFGLYLWTVYWGRHFSGISDTS